MFTVDGISLAVPSAEHPPAWDGISLMLFFQLNTLLPGMESAWCCS
jgi:hypothetical protein